MIRIFAVSGFKNSGKTTLCMKLLEELGRLGVRTGYIKRTADEALSPRAADTGRAAGLGVSSALWGSDGLRIESPAAGVTPEYIVSRYFPDADIVIVEGENISTFRKYGWRTASRARWKSEAYS